MGVHFRVNERVLDQLAYLLQNARYSSKIAVPIAWQQEGEVHLSRQLVPLQYVVPVTVKKALGLCEPTGMYNYLL